MTSFKALALFALFQTTISAPAGIDSLEIPDVQLGPSISRGPIKISHPTFPWLTPASSSSSSQSSDSDNIEIEDTGTTTSSSSAATTSLPSFANTKITSTSGTLEQVASAAITQLLTYDSGTTGTDLGEYTFTGLGWWQSANAYTEIFDFDLYTHGTEFKNTAGQDLHNLIPLSQEGRNQLINNFNDDSMWWALACLDGYGAYGDSTFMSQAVKIWNWVHSTSQIVKTGIAPDLGGIQRTATVSTSCQLQNGVYWTTDTDETYVNSIATGLFMQVSARLYENTKNSTYLTGAKTSMSWLQEHTVDPTSKLVTLDGVHVDCSVGEGEFTYNTGVYIGALVSLYWGTGDTSYLTEAETAGASAMTTSAWTDGNGMITESEGATVDSDGVGFRSILIRNLMQLFHATQSSSLKQEITGFVNVNYNSLYNKARSGNNYDVNWFGPFTSATSYGQFSAVDLLNAGMLVNGGA